MTQVDVARVDLTQDMFEECRVTFEVDYTAFIALDGVLKLLAPERQNALVHVEFFEQVWVGGMRDFDFQVRLSLLREQFAQRGVDTRLLGRILPNYVDVRVVLDDVLIFQIGFVVQQGNCFRICTDYSTQFVFLRRYRSI